MPEGDAPEDPTAAFQAEARAFLEAHARPRRAGEDDFARFRFLGDPSPEADTEHVMFRVRFVPRVGWTPYRELRVWRHRPDIRFVGAIHESMLPAVEIGRASCRERVWIPV